MRNIPVRFLCHRRGIQLLCRFLFFRSVALRFLDDLLGMLRISLRQHALRLGPLDRSGPLREVRSCDLAHLGKNPGADPHPAFLLLRIILCH